MKLLFSATSPYVRKVLVVALEVGVDDRIEREPTNPFAPDSRTAEVNPLGKVPALTADNGAVLFDSPVICEYLDSLHDGSKVFPPTGTPRWQALCQQALADGVMDASVLWRLEGLRDEAERSAGWSKRQIGVVTRGLGELERMQGQLGDAATIGTISIACALGYLDLRLGHLDWRSSAPKLARWYAAFSARPSMQATAHPT